MIELRLHGAIWKGAGERRGEWQRMLDELNAENSLASVQALEAEDLSIEIVRMPSGTFAFRLYADVFERLDTVTLDAEVLDTHFRDYAQTIRHMVHVQSDAPARGFESLDYAKRVVHDEAGELMQSALSLMLTMTKEDARRLFTLLFLIAGDLPEHLVRFHRFH